MREKKKKELWEIDENGYRFYKGKNPAKVSIPKTQEKKHHKKKKSISAKSNKPKKTPAITPEILPDPFYKSSESPQHQILEQTAKAYFQTHYSCIIVNHHVAYPGIYVAADYMVRRHAYNGHKKNRLKCSYLLIECLTSYSVSPEIIKCKLQLNIKDRLIFIVPNYRWIHELFSKNDKVIFVEVDLDKCRGRVAKAKLLKYQGGIKFKDTWINAMITSPFTEQITELDESHYKALNAGR